ncbi:L,D-transpeptidase family protein [Streptomyces yaizuensis]|uniref:L,D-transpeptidase family protein n=1 Tax=Streptomyces yaizuensis TaxID=2989713 RepID=A0ABQ5P1Y0_9ACTN|nr:L,D-transpeptidase family protein [Streptomyces sp. YSPA8]GLF96618.1 L,D-transpeptidase family protein [Streptomyces sp. YSPA8]
MSPRTHHRQARNQARDQSRDQSRDQARNQARHRIRPLVAAALAAVVLLTGCTVGGDEGGDEGGDDGRGGSTAASSGAREPGADKDTGSGPDAENRSGAGASRREARRGIPGLGPRTLARIGDARQVFVVGAEGPDANRATAALYERHPTQGWQRTAGPWPTRNGRKGWTDDHRMNDLRTPTGVYGLTDAGGLRPDPGTRLPYDRGPAFDIRGENAEGEPLRGAFDHVVAINYNRVPGRTPLDWETPLGIDRGRGIWIHVDHGSGTQGCVSLARPRVAELLRRLDPAARPVVAMGPEEFLAR